MEEKGEKKDGKGRGGGGSGPVSRTDIAIGGSAGVRCSTLNDDARGVVLDVSVTAGERAESQVEAVRIGARAREVTADSGYVPKVYGIGAPGRGRAPSKKEPSQSRVPLRLFRYNIRHDGEVSARQRSQRGAGALLLRGLQRLQARSSKEVLIPHAYPALLRARRRHARWGEEERRMWRRHMWRCYHGEFVAAWTI